MSVVSSRVSSVSSILKTPGIRSQFTRRSRVSFKIPENLKDIIFNFESGNGRKEYEELIYLLKECNIEDNDLLEFLVNVRQCISLLGANHKLLVEAILQIRWTNRSKETAVAYKAFLEDLICMQIYHIKCIIDSLVDQFKPGLDDKVKWIDSKSKEQDLLKLNHIHDVLRKILKVVPMSKQLLLNSIRAKFPYMTLGVHMYEVYTSSLLEILKYAPELRSEILCLIISRLMILDVHIPRPKHENEEQENQEEEEEEEMEDDRGCDERVTTNNNDINKISSNVELITDTLDTCMEQLFTHLHECCFKNETVDMEALRSLYFDILKLFETVILPTHAIQFVQYIIFYICSFKTALVEAFIDWLWRKTTDLNVPSVIRQSAVCYVGSLLASASYVQPRLIKTVLSNMSQWIHNYILTNTDNERGEHWVFYTVCQALFLLIISRYKDFINSKEDILFLYELNLDKIVTCKLNPLKMCEPHIVFRFADITKTYQLAYCYTIIENNSRNTLPVAESQYSTRLETFFPFGTYKLELSGKKVTPLIYYCAINFKRKESSKDLYENIEFMTE